MKKYITLGFFVLLLFSLSVVSFADTYTLYGNLSASETIANNLVGMYLNQPDYDPYNEFYCCRIGQYSYILVYGQNLADSYKFIGYDGVQSGYQVSYSYSFGSGNDLTIHNNGYSGVGNIEHSIKSDKAENYKFGYVAVVGIILIVILLLFKVFRLRIHTRSDRGWTV